MTELKKELKSIINSTCLRSKKEEAYGYHGSSSGVLLEYEVYWDELRNEWLPGKDYTLRNNVLKKLTPLIDELISEINEGVNK